MCSRAERCVFLLGRSGKSLLAFQKVELAFNWSIQEQRS